MQRRTHTLPSDATGTTRWFDSLHFGSAANGKKAYLQASLHADEPPGVLVLHHLARLLSRAENDGRIAGEIVLVPMANPIGLSQRLLYQTMGRFEMNSAQNFNRQYPDLIALLPAELVQQLGPQGAANVARIRAALGDALMQQRATSELDGLRLALVQLAFDADIVLDLHCDNEAVMHLYSETPYWPQAEILARYLGAQVSLLAEGSGSAAGGSFDEALSGLWWRLPRLCAAQGLAPPVLPLATFAATVELRGQADVSHALAQEDAQHLYDYLAYQQLIDVAAAPPPPLLGEPTPLAGSMRVVAPHGGAVAFLCALGQRVLAGTPIADIVDPLSERISTVTAPVAGCFYARMADRIVHAQQSIGRIAGQQALRQGALLGP